jgi:hypothetical protein
VTPRRTRPKKRRKPLEDERERISADLAVASPPGWHVRAIQPANALKTYRCPGCNQEIRPGTAHVVAWRDDDEEGRRHWHTPCWRRFAKNA